MVNYVRMVHVLFVCMGNICCSPLAQDAFEEVVRREGLEDEIYVGSAGTGSYHVGEASDLRAQENARRQGLDLDSRRSGWIGPEEFDYVPTMMHEKNRA